MKNKLLLILVLIIATASTVMAVEAPIYYGDSSVPVKQNKMIFDSNDTGGDIWLQFGNALTELLFWDANGGDGTGIFTFTDSLFVQGFLSILPAALPGSPSAGDIVIDSGAGNTLKWYNGSSWQSAGGSGGGVKKFLVDPKTGLHQADGATNNCDSWQEYDYTDKEHYNKIQGNVADQDLDIIYNAWLPSDFSSWDTTAIAVVYKTSSATPSTSGVYCNVYDTNMALAHTSSLVASTGEAAFTFSSTNLTNGSEVWTAANHFLIECKAAVDSAAWVDIGRVELTYNS